MHKFQIFVLVWLSFHNALHTIFMRYSRSRKVEHMYLPSVAVFWLELIKLVICLIAVTVEYGSIPRGLSATRKVLFDHPVDTLKVGIPAFVYTLSNNCFFVAATYLDAATFAVSAQLKLLTTAVFAVLILRKQLSPLQWVSLLILFAGVSTVQIPTSSGSKKNPSESKNSIDQNSDHNFFIHGEAMFGFLMAFLACLLTGFAGVYFEKILKSKGPSQSIGEISVWMRNIQMTLSSVPIALIAAMIQDGRVIRNQGFLYGFDYVVWLTVCWHSIGGLSVALCIKYTDNIQKNFATSVAILLSTVISIYVFNFWPSVYFAIGAAMVIGAIFMYSKYPAPSQSVVMKASDQKIVEMESGGLLSTRNNYEHSETGINVNK